MSAGAACSDGAHKQPWADVEDSPPLEPTQVFPSTPESMQDVLSQSSVHAAREVFPSTPDSFEGGSQPHTGLTQEFRSTMTIQQTTEEPQLDNLQEPSIAGTFMATQTDGLLLQSAASQQPAAFGWSPHQLRPAAVAIQENSPQRQKRGVQSPSKLPAEKRPRPDAGAGPTQENTVGSWGAAASSSSAASAQRPPPSSGTTSHQKQLRRSSGASSGAAHARVEQRPRPNSGASSRPGNPIGNMRGSPSPEPATKEDLERRQMHRQSGADGVRKSPDYLFLVALWESGGPIGAPAPRHRPEDVADVSKRQWEKNMQDWRHEVRRLAVLHGYVHVGPEQ